MRLEVRDVVLIWEGRDRLAQRRHHVLVDRVLLLGLNGGEEQLVWVGDLERLEDALLNLAHVVQLRELRGALRHGLHLRKALRLAEDVGVADGHHVHRTLEVLAGGQLFADLLLRVLVVEVHAVEPVQDAEHARHCGVQSGVDRAEHDHALLEVGERRAHRRVRVAVRHVLEGRADDALTRVHEEAEQLEQHRAGRVERQRHRDLADVVHVQAALDLLDLCRLYVEGLPAARAALELEHRRRVVDVRAVEQRTERASRGGADAADHVRQADGVRAAPRHERELYKPVQLLAALVWLIPVAINRKHLAGRLVDGDDVRGELALRDVVALHAQQRVDFVHGAEAVLVVAGVAAALDLVVGLLHDAALGLEARRRQVHVAVHARLDALLVVHLRDVLDVRLALRAIEAGRGVGQEHVVDCDEQEARPVADVVP